MLLQVKNLRCGYGSLEVVHGISLHVCPGEIVGLLGGNGAGKTTLLKALVGLLRPWRGEILVNGRPVHNQPAWRCVSNAVALVPEGRQIFADMTVRENLLIGGYHNAYRRMDVEMVLERFPRLAERIHQLGGTLSGGEQQMLSIGRAMMSRPRVLLLDEPSLGLAPILIREIFKELARINREGVTVLLVEQNARQALMLSHRGYVLQTGRIVMHGPSAELLSNPDVKAAYLGKLKI